MAGCPATQVARGRQRECVVVARRQAEGVLPRSQLLGRERRRHRRDRRSRPTAARRSASRTASAAGSTAKSWTRRRRSGGRPTARKVAFYRFDESQVKDFYLQMDQTQFRARSTSRRIRRPAPTTRSPTCFVYDVAAKQTHEARRARRQAVHQRRRRPLRLQRRAGRRTARAADEPHQPPAADHGVRRAAIRRRRSAASSSARSGRPAGSTTARRCAGSRTTSGSSGSRSATAGRTTTSTISTGKLINPITQHTTFEVGRDRQGGRSRRRLFYMARDGDNYMKMQLHRVGLDGKGDVRLTDPKFTHTVDALARQQVLRRRLSDARPAAGDAAASTSTGKVVARARQERHDASSTQLGLKKVEMFTLHGGRRQDDALRHDLRFRRTSIRRRSTRRSCRSTAGRRRAATCRPRTFATPNADDRVRLPGGATSARARRRAWGGATLDSIYLKLGVRPRWTTWPRASRRSGRGRTSTRTASASTARRTAATRRRCRSCGIPTSSRPRRPRRR